MSYFFAIILILILVWMFFGDRIKVWAQRRMMEKMEDAFRAQMGMPSGAEERKRRRQAEKNQRRHQQATRDRYGNRVYVTPGPNANAPSSQSVGKVIIPPEYAVDVEFVEYKEFTSTTTVLSEDGGSTTARKSTTTVIESQVTDVEFVEIKNPV